jgi:methylglutaconyl-CoA hydratase
VKEFTTIKLEFQEDIAVIWLDRPDIHNAYNETMIYELMEAFKYVNKNSEVSIVILKGKGKSFCAGADLNWMKDIVKYSYDQNYLESLQLSRCFYTIYTCKKPTIAIVHGAVIGGGIGFLTACDFAFCDDETLFSLNDVKIGLIPASISPYVVKRIGEFASRDLMLTGKRLKGQEAENCKLVNKSLSKNLLDDYVSEIIDQLRTSGPGAMSFCKNLLYDISNTLTIDEAVEYTAKMTADVRASDEGQEGMAAFLKKRKPNWIRNKS